MAKKSFYLFLTSLLGVLLFLTLHRIAFFFYFYLLAAGYVRNGLDYYQLFALEYFSLMIFLMFGIWYGIWLGLGWFSKVYEEKSHGGFVDHLATKVFSSGRDAGLEAKLAAAKARLESDVAKVEELAEAALEKRAASEPIKRKVVKKKTVKK